MAELYSAAAALVAGIVLLLLEWRRTDNWRPLFAIADLIGFDWPGRIRQAALALAPRDSESTGPMFRCAWRC